MKANFLKKVETGIARQIRLLAVWSFYKNGSITESEGKQVLAGELSPGNPETKIDDSEYLKESYTEQEISQILDSFVGKGNE